jgi:hypothetical protein
MLARAQPTVDMFIWFRFRDAPGELSSGGLLDQAGRPKAALSSFAAAADCYRLLADPCVEQAKLTTTSSGGVSSFGSGVALAADGNTALVGASGSDSAWIFSRSGSSWHPGRRLTPTDEDGNARFGSSVALSADGDTAVVGGAADDGGVGAVWVFVRSGSSWTQAGPKLTADDESGNGRFGGAVAVSANGATVLVGAHGDAAGLGAAWLFRAYPVWARASRAAWAFLNAIRPLASWRSARWFSSFFDQRIRSARFRFSQEWHASTTQRRARQPGVRSLSRISSPRVRMCGVYFRSAVSSRTTG